MHFSNNADKRVIHESGLQTSVGLKGDMQTHTLKTWPWSVCVLTSQMLFCLLSLFMAEQIIIEKQDEFCFSWRAQTHSTPPLPTRPRFEELIWTICMQMTRHFSFDIYHLQCLCICKSVLKILVWSEQLCEAKQEWLFCCETALLLCVFIDFSLYWWGFA